jgi:hypothetical protein
MTPPSYYRQKKKRWHFFTIRIPHVSSEAGPSHKETLKQAVRGPVTNTAPASPLPLHRRILYDSRRPESGTPCPPHDSILSVEKNAEIQKSNFLPPKTESSSIWPSYRGVFKIGGRKLDFWIFSEHLPPFFISGKNAEIQKSNFLPPKTESSSIWPSYRGVFKIGGRKLDFWIFSMVTRLVFRVDHIEVACHERCGGGPS